MAADFEEQIPAVLDLIVRVLIMKPAVPLLFQVEGKAQAGGINPTLADLVQSPYSPSFGQDVCDLRQACGVGNMSKTVAFFRKANSCLSRLASYVLVPVQDHLHGKRRMPTDLDRDVAPLGIEDMKGVVIYVGHRLFALEMVRWADILDRCLSATRDVGLGPVLFCNVVFALAH